MTADDFENNIFPCSLQKMQRKYFSIMWRTSALATLCGESITKRNDSFFGLTLSDTLTVEGLTDDVKRDWKGFETWFHALKEKGNIEIPADGEFDIYHMASNCSAWQTSSGYHRTSLQKAPLWRILKIQLWWWYTTRYKEEKAHSKNRRLTSGDEHKGNPLYQTGQGIDQAGKSETVISFDAHPHRKVIRLVTNVCRVNTGNHV